MRRVVLRPASDCKSYGGHNGITHILITIKIKLSQMLTR